MLSPDSILTENTDPDYVGLIQDWTCKNNGTIPLYHFEENYYQYSYRHNLVIRDNRMDKIQFRCFLTIDDNLPEFTGVGDSKSEA